MTTLDLSCSGQTCILLLLTPNMHACLKNSTNWESCQYGKINLFFNPEEGDFLTTRITCRSKLSLHERNIFFCCRSFITLSEEIAQSTVYHHLISTPVKIILVIQAFLLFLTGQVYILCKQSQNRSDSKYEREIICHFIK